MEAHTFSKWQIVLLVALFWAVASQAQMPNHERPDEDPKKELLDGVKGAVVVKPEDQALKLDDKKSKPKSKASKTSKENSQQNSPSNENSKPDQQKK
jgi:hypothetical protein